MSEFVKGKTTKGKKLVLRRKPTTSALLMSERILNTYKREHSYCTYVQQPVTKKIKLGTKIATNKKVIVSPTINQSTSTKQSEIVARPSEKKINVVEVQSVPEKQTYLRCKDLTLLQTTSPKEKDTTVPVVPARKVVRPVARKVYVSKKTQKPDQTDTKPKITIMLHGIEEQLPIVEIKTEPDAVELSSEDEDELTADRKLLRNVDVSEIYLTDIIEKQKLSAMEHPSKEENCISTFYAFMRDGDKHFSNEVSSSSLNYIETIGAPIILTTFNDLCEITMYTLLDLKHVIVFKEKTKNETVDKEIYLDFMSKIHKYDIPNNEEIRLYYLWEENGTDGLRELDDKKALEILSSNNFQSYREYQYTKFNVYKHEIAYPKNIQERSEHFRQKRTYLFEFAYPTHTNVLIPKIKDFHMKIINHILDKVSFIRTYYTIKCKPIISNFYEHTLREFPKEETINEEVLKSIPILEQMNTGGILKLSVFSMKEVYLVEYISLTPQSRLTHVRALRRLFAVKEQKDKRKMLRDCILVPGICIACQYEFQTQAQYFRHKDETGHSQQMRRCKFCKEILPNEDALSDHLIDTHHPNDFDCENCKTMKVRRVLCDEHAKELLYDGKDGSDEPVDLYEVLEVV